MRNQKTVVARDAGHHYPEPAQSHGHFHDGGDNLQGPILTIRAHSGLSGDMFLAGLLHLTNIDEQETNRLLSSIAPDLSGTVHLTRRQVKGIGVAEIKLPHQHEHRKLDDIATLIGASGIDDRAKSLALDTFSLLAKAEAFVHGKRPEDIHFHEVGALDSILDICMTCELFCRLGPSRLVVSPLPIADGDVTCAHGILPVPAPAVLELLEGIPVCPFPDRGETVTPTALALLRSLGATFGLWPAMRVEKQALVYGKRIFANAPNGAIFAYGAGQIYDVRQR